jgi:hypothetical protein|tara:strand:+ start:566 stop:832 length:267 start_codon:yes stop_codon:yes gene_type:complete
MNDVIGKDYIQKFIAKNVKTANYTKSSQNGMGNKDRLIRNLYIWAERQYDEKTTWTEIAKKYDLSAVTIKNIYLTISQQMEEFKEIAE